MPPPAPKPVARKLVGTKWERRLSRRKASSAVAAHERALIETAIVDSGAMGWYLRPDAPVSAVDPAAEKIRVGTANGHVEESAASCELPLPGMPPGLFGHIMSAFKHNLIGIGGLCDADCKVLFSKHTVVVYDKNK